MKNKKLRIFTALAAIAALPLAGCQSTGEWMGGLAAAPAQPVMIEPQAGLVKAKQQFRDQNYGLAEESFRALVEKDPSNAEAWLGLGASYDELRRFDLADRAYAQVLRLTGPTAQLLNNRGYSQLMRGNYKAARRDLYAARAKDPGNPAIANNITLLDLR
jgi:Flp pilus assembly protein TadD